MGDAGEVLFGALGREIFGAAQVIFLIFIMASHILTFVVAMNAITKHVTCSIVWGVVGMVISFILSLPRTLEKMSWLSIVCKIESIVSEVASTILTARAAFVSILSAVITTMVAVGVMDAGHGVVAIYHTNLLHGFSAVCNIVFAFCKSISGCTSTPASD